MHRYVMIVSANIMILLPLFPSLCRSLFCSLLLFVVLSFSLFLSSLVFSSLLFTVFLFPSLLFPLSLSLPLSISPVYSLSLSLALPLSGFLPSFPPLPSARFSYLCISVSVSMPLSLFLSISLLTSFSFYIYIWVCMYINTCIPLLASLLPPLPESVCVFPFSFPLPLFLSIPSSPGLWARRSGSRLSL